MMNKFNLTTIAAAIVLAFSVNAMAAPDAAKAESNAAAPAAKTETPGAYVDDSVITGKVKALILEEKSLKSAEINVETYKGIVQLTGFVSSRAAIKKAVKIARSVKGVQSVKNDMIVKGKQ
jgi:osmotically-inducible protein OsmY